MASLSIIFLIVSLIRAYATNPCIDSKLALGFSFLESVKLCQMTDDTSRAIEPTSESMTLSSFFIPATKRVPARVLDLAPRGTAMPTFRNVHPHMPYILAASCLFS